MRRLDRYLIQEIVGPFSLGLLVYTFIMLMDFLFRSAEMIIRRGVPAGDVGKLLLYSLPNIIVLTVPMSFLFGVLVAVGRISSESELTAMRASGVSLYQLLRPVMILSLIVTLLTSILSVPVLPRANSLLTKLFFEIAARSVSRQVEAGVFYDEWESRTLYVFDTEPNDASRWRGVFLAETEQSPDSNVYIARDGSLSLDGMEDRLRLSLNEAEIHSLYPERGEKYEHSSARELNPVLEDLFLTRERNRSKTSKGLRELTVSELRERTKTLKEPQLRNLAQVEIHKKFSIPAACLVFGLIGLALGHRSGRGAKSAGFVLSIVIIAIYWLLISNGEEAARIGQMAPWLSMWLPNVLLGAFGLFALDRRNRDRGLLPGRLDHWLRTQNTFGQLFVRWNEKKKANRSRVRTSRERRLGGERLAGRPKKQPGEQNQPGARYGGSHGEPHGERQVVLRIPRLRLRFPNLIDRYVIRQFCWLLVLVSASGVMLYIVADLSQNMDEILKRSIPRDVVIDYYKFRAMQILYDIAPILILVTTLITFGMLSRANEVTAVKALGMSLYRLSLPAIVVAGSFALFAVFLQSEVLPASNEKAAILKSQIRGRAAPNYRRGDKQWLYGKGRYIYHYSDYDGVNRTLKDLQVFEFDEQYNLSRRLFAESARFLGGDIWMFDNAWIRTFGPDGVVDYRAFDEPAADRFPQTATYFEEEVRQPDQMTFGELSDHIRDVRESGRETPVLEVQLHNKIAFPVVSFVMAMVALPFAFRLGKRGALYGIGIAIVVGMVFMAIYAFSSTLGSTGALPPLLAVWFPGICFSVLSAYLFLGVQT